MGGWGRGCCRRSARGGDRRKALHVGLGNEAVQRVHSWPDELGQEKLGNDCFGGIDAARAIVSADAPRVKLAHCDGQA